MHRLLIICLIFLTSQSFSQDINEVRRITETLCSSGFHGRGYVNKGDSIASRFLADEFKKLGIDPYKKSYFQDFTIDAVNTFPGKVELKVGDRELEPGKHYLVDPSSGGMQGEINPKPIPIETALNPEKLSVQLKEVMHSPVYNAVLFDFRDLGADTLKKVYGLSQAFAEFLPVVEIKNDKFMWSVGRDQLKYPVVQIQDSVFSIGQTLDIDLEAKLISDYQTQNVIAYIPARKKCKETIVFSAHYDHLGRLGMDTYFPGANDNASGTAMLLTMAKYFKEHPSEYNIMFIAFAGEEAGLLGSKYYTEHPLFKLKKIRFLINLDIMGSGEEGITVVNATLFEDEFKLLQDISEKEDLLAQVKKRGPAINSDHYWFTEKGVPAFFIYTMGPNKNYHDVFDTYEELSFNEYYDITTLLVKFVESIQ